MRRFITIALFFGFFFGACMPSNAQRFEWVEALGLPVQTPNNFEIEKVFLDDSSNYFIGFNYFSSVTIKGVTLNSSGKGCGIIKLDSHRNVLWSFNIISVNGLNNFELTDFILDSTSNIYFLLSYCNTINLDSQFVVNIFGQSRDVIGKINSNGQIAFAFQLEVSRKESGSTNVLKIGSDGSIYACSATNSILSPSSSAIFGYLTRFSPQGAQLFSTTQSVIGSGGFAFLYFLGIEFDTNGDIVVLAKTRSDGSSSIVNGISSINKLGYFIIRYSKTTGLAFDTKRLLGFTFDGSFINHGFIEKGGNGRFFISGDFSGQLAIGSNISTFDNTSNVLVLEYDLVSGITWHKVLTSNGGLESIFDFKVSNSAIYLSGLIGTQSSYNGIQLLNNGPTGFVASLDSIGNINWAKYYTQNLNLVAPIFNAIRFIQPQQDGSLFFSATSEGNTGFDDSLFTSTGWSNWIGRISCLPRNISDNLQFPPNSSPCFNTQTTVLTTNFPFTNYNWTATGGGVISAVGNQATVSWPNPGTYTVSVNPFNACGTSNGRSANVTVRGAPPQPDSLIGDTVVCFTGTRAYSIPLVNDAASYNWSLSGGGSLIPLSNTAIVNWNTPGTYTLRVAPVNDCGIGDTLIKTITVTTPPTQPGAIAGATDVCTGNQNYTLPGLPGTDYLWSVSSGGTLSSNGSTATINWSVAGTHTITVIPSNGCATGPSRNLTVTVKQAPGQPSSIIGNNNSCLGFQNYSILETTGTNYTWNLSGGGTLSAFAGSATINWNQGGVHVLSVTPQNSCGSGPARSLQIIINDVPPPPGPIQGIDTVCLGAQTYAVPAQSGTNYNWTLSGGGSLTPTGSSALVNWTNPGSYTLTVSPVNICGLGNQVIKQVFVRNVTAQIAGISGSNSACLVSENYSVPLLTGFTYNWSLSGGGTLTATANNAQVAWNAPGNYALTVSTNDGCSRALLVNVRDVPAQPGLILGDTVSCLLSKPYSVSAIPNVSYQWSLSGGGVLNFGQGNASVNWTGTGSHQLQVTPSNQCGNGPSRAVTVQVNDVPNLPSLIQGSDSTCTVSRTYSVLSAPGTNYQWAVTGGGQLNGNGAQATVNWSNRGVFNLSVTPSNTCGSGATRSRSIWVESFPLTPTVTGDTVTCLGNEVYRIIPININQYTWQLATGGNLVSGADSASINWTSTGIHQIAVTASNFCGNAVPAVYSVRVKTLPNTPTILNGDTLTCLGNRVYSVPLQAETGWAWNLSGGGQLSPLSNTLTINWTQPGTFTLSATPSNLCGIGGSIQRTIRVQDIPQQPAAIFGNTNLCLGNATSFSVSNIPGTTYSWNLSAGGTLSPSGSSATLNMNTSGNFLLSVVPSNLCGTGPSRSVALVAATIPALPASITGDALTCLGSKVYSTSTPTGNALNWTLSSGGSLNASGSSATVTWTTTGNHLITVSASNFCGVGPAQSLSVVSITTPSQPPLIVGDTFSCPGNKVYQVPSMSGVSYNWTLSSGGTLSVAGNSVVVNWQSPGTHQLSVLTSNICGVSPVRNLSIRTDVIPSQPGLITGPAEICRGIQGTYQVNADAGISYQWLAGGATVVSSMGGMASVLFPTAGVFNLEVRPSNACGTGPSRLYQVNVQSAPQVNQQVEGLDSICLDETEFYDLPSLANISYNWDVSDDNDFRDFGNAISIRWRKAGVFEIIAVPFNSCGSGDSIMKKVWVFGPEVKPQITFRNDTLFSSSPDNNQWFVNNTLVEGANESFFLPDRNSVIQLRIVNPCFSGEVSEFITYSFLDPADFGIEVYPNPASDWLTIKFPVNLNWNNIQLQDLTGKGVYRSSFNGSYQIDLDVSKFAIGMYHLKLETEAGTFYKKITIK